MTRSSCVYSRHTTSNSLLSEATRRPAGTKLQVKEGVKEWQGGSWSGQLRVSNRGTIAASSRADGSARRPRVAVSRSRQPVSVNSQRAADGSSRPPMISVASSGAAAWRLLYQHPRPDLECT